MRHRHFGVLLKYTGHQTVAADIINALNDTQKERMREQLNVLSSSTQKYYPSNLFVHIKSAKKKNKLPTHQTLIQTFIGQTSFYPLTKN